MSVTATETLEVVRCCYCGIVFGMTEALIEQRQEDGRSFYCPNRHEQHFSNSLAARSAKAETARAYWEKEAQRLLAETDRLRDQVVMLRKAWWRRLVPRFLRRGGSK